MRPNFELSHLKYFYFTALDGKVGLAAERLCVQQPVVSKMIRSLEDQFGQALFKKQGRGKVLTDFGQLVYRHCQTAFRELENLENIRKGPAFIAGPINIGAVEPVAAHLLTPALTQLMTEFKGLHPNVYTSTAQQLLNLLLEQKLDVGMFFHLPHIPEGLEIVRRKAYRFRVVVAAKHKTNVKVIESFIGSREIDDNSTHKFPTVEKLRKSYSKTRIVFSSNHLGLHREMVLAGNGVSILPDFLIADDLKKRRLVDLYPQDKQMFDLKFVAQKSKVFAAPALKLLSLF